MMKPYKCYFFYREDKDVVENYLHSKIFYL